MTVTVEALGRGPILYNEQGDPYLPFVSAADRGVTLPHPELDVEVLSEEQMAASEASAAAMVNYWACELENTAAEIKARNSPTEAEWPPQERLDYRRMVTRANAFRDCIETFTNPDLSWNQKN
jgi:hypothetical protein